MKKKINLDKDLLIKLYIEENKTVKEIAAELNLSAATINRQLQKYEIKKDETLRRASISKTKQAKTDEEKTIYSQHISEARKGKGLGITPWNKGKKGLQVAWNKGLKMSEDFSNKVVAGIAEMSSEQKQQQSRHLSKALTGRIPSNKGKKMSAEQKEKLKQVWPSFSKEVRQAIIQKQYNTKILNKTCNTSIPEDIYYKCLVNKYGVDDVVRQYSTDLRYPFACDFYIKSLDLFIELNLSWTHGGRLFTGSTEDLAKLAIWQEKAGASDFYKNAIETWTVRDVKKAEAAKNNNLNYKVYYSEDELYTD